jgi:hypothetical protein
MHPTPISSLAFHSNRILSKARPNLSKNPTLGRTPGMFSRPTPLYQSVRFNVNFFRQLSVENGSPPKVHKRFCGFSSKLSSIPNSRAFGSWVARAEADARTVFDHDSLGVSHVPRIVCQLMATRLERALGVGR